jgi:hypothetical protein
MKQSPTFFIPKGIKIHKLQQISQRKNYSINIGSDVYHYCLEKLIFISLNAFDHFESFFDPFDVNPEQFHNINHILIHDLKSSFRFLDSLFHSSSTIEINDTNVLSLFILTAILDNQFLLSKCEKYSTTHPQSFSFSFKQLRYLHQKDKNSLNDLQISVNGVISQRKEYSINIGSDVYHYCLEKLIFISLNAFDHFESSSDPFDANPEQFPNVNHILIHNLKSSFRFVDSLFHSSSTIEINDANVLSLFILTAILDNQFLLSKCEKHSTTHPQSFSFSFKQLKYLHQKDRNL